MHGPRQRRWLSEKSQAQVMELDEILVSLALFVICVSAKTRLYRFKVVYSPLDLRSCCVLIVSLDTYSEPQQMHVSSCDTAHGGSSYGPLVRIDAVHRCRTCEIEDGVFEQTTVKRAVRKLPIDMC